MGWIWLEQIGQDLRYGLRVLGKKPGFTAVGVLSLALGIGATVAVFSVIYDAVLHAWPYAGFDRVCDIWTIDKAGHEGVPALTGPQIRQLRQAHAVEDVAGMQGWNLTVTGGDVPEDVVALDFTGNAFPFFGMPAMLGRYILPSDAPDTQDPQPVAVLSYKFWQRHFNGDPSVVGKNIQVSHKDYVVVGVMPPRFTWMDADVYLPLKMAQDPASLYKAVVKLKKGIRPVTAEAEFWPLFEQFDKEKPNYFPPHFRISVRLSGQSYTRSLGSTLNLLFAAVALLLVIGCCNVAILLLAQGTARQHEFAVRSAVGAGRSRIVRQLLTESLLLALTGAVLGALLAHQAVGSIVARLPEYSFPHEADFHVNLPTLLFSVGVAILSAVVFGIFPALVSGRREINQGMLAGTRTVRGSLRGKRVYSGLIAGQISMTLLLLNTAAIAIAGFSRMMRRPLGYDPHHVMSVFIPIHENAFTTWAERATYFAQLRDRVATMPGVVSAGISSNATPPSNGWTQPFEILGKTATESQEVRANFVGPEYFSVLHIPLAEGRLWDQAEVSRSAPLAVVNQTFARRYFPDKHALGNSLRLPRLTSQPPYLLAAPGSDGWVQIVGVAVDAVNDGLDKPIFPAIYLPYPLSMSMGTQILVRAQGNPLTMLHGVRQEIAGVNPDQQVASGVDDLESWIIREPQWARSRLISILFAVFSGLALTLAAVGLYSVASYSVAQRTSEFGIRMAFGAHRSDVLRIVALSAGTNVGLGLASGVVLSLGLSRVVTRWVEDPTLDPWLMLGVPLLVIVVCAVACLVPAERALSVDPMDALRHE